MRMHYSDFTVKELLFVVFIGISVLYTTKLLIFCTGCAATQTAPIAVQNEPNSIEATNVEISKKISQDVAAVKAEVLAEIDTHVQTVVKGMENNYSKVTNVDAWTNRLLVVLCFVFTGVFCLVIRSSTLRNAERIASASYEAGRQARLVRETRMKLEREPGPESPICNCGGCKQDRKT